MKRGFRKGREKERTEEALKDFRSRAEEGNRAIRGLSVLRVRKGDESMAMDMESPRGS